MTDDPNDPRAHVRPPAGDEHVSPDGLDDSDASRVVEDKRTPAGLIPFRAGEEWPREAGRRSAAARRARRAVERAKSEDIAAALSSLVASYGRENLGDVAAAAALDMIGRVQRGEVSPRDPTEWVRVLVDIARLERGQATSAALVAHISGEDSATRLSALQTSARAALARVNGSGPSLVTEAERDNQASEDEDPTP